MALHFIFAPFVPDLRIYQVRTLLHAIGLSQGKFIRWFHNGESINQSIRTGSVSHYYFKYYASSATKSNESKGTKANFKHHHYPIKMYQQEVYRFATTYSKRFT
jgi:hypothetical protein